MNWAEQWRQAVTGSFSAVLNEVGRFLPNLVGFLVILVIGYLVSRLIQRIATPAARKLGIDRATDRADMHQWLGQAGLKSTPSELIGRCVFWLFMLVFFVSATDALGLDNVSQTIQSFVAYVPNIIAAMAILIVGLLVARFLSGVVRRGLDGVADSHAGTLSRVVYGFAVTVVCIAAISQLQIETALVSRVIEISMVAVGAGMALTLGLGTREVARNVMAGIYIRDVYRPGMEISTETGAEGVVGEVSTVNTRIRGSSGETVWIPNTRLMNSIVSAPPRSSGSRAS